MQRQYFAATHQKENGLTFAVARSDIIRREVQQAIGPQVVALAVFGAIAALAMLVLAGQGLAQLISRSAQDIAVLRALGGSRAQTALAAMPAGRGRHPRGHDPRRGRRDSALPAGPGRPGTPVRSGPRRPGGRPGPGGRLSPAGRDPARGAGRDGRTGHPAGHPPGPRAAVRRRACGGGRRVARTGRRGQPQRAGAGIGAAGGPGPRHLARVHRRGDGRDRRRRVRGQPDRPGHPPGPVRLELADPDPGRGRVRELHAPA